MTRILAAAAMAPLIIAAAPVQAQQVDWQYPAVESYGPVVPVPDATAKRQAGEGYRVVFDITEASPGEGRVSNELALVARFVNLLALSDMEPKASEIVAVVHGAATGAVVQDQAYRARYGTPNPNSELIAQLEENGVEVVVCGQALASAGFPVEAVLEPVDVSISAMTELASRQLQGYALMP